MEFICFAFAMPLIRGARDSRTWDAQMPSLGNMVLMFAILCAGYIIFINELNGTIDWRVLMLAVGAVLVGIAGRYLLGGDGKN